MQVFNEIKRILNVRIGSPARRSPVIRLAGLFFSAAAAVALPLVTYLITNARRLVFQYYVHLRVRYKCGLRLLSTNYI